MNEFNVINIETSGSLCMLPIKTNQTVTKSEIIFLLENQNSSFTNKEAISYRNCF